MKENFIIESEEAVLQAVKFLKDGKLVSIQAETVYGLACDPGKNDSIRKVFNLKKRPKLNPLIIHVNSIKMAEDIALLNDDARKLMKKFWPGPLTLILPKKKNSIVKDSAVAGLNTIAVRMPNSKIFIQIINKLKRPLAAPSANESGYISSTNANHVIDSFGEKIDLVIDSGKAFFGLESTIVDLTQKPYLIKRLGVLDENQIFNLSGVKVFFKDSAITNNLKPNSPGQLEKHYSPRTPIKLNVILPKKNDAYLTFGDYTPKKHKNFLNLSNKGNLNEAAHNLFDYLRKLDKMKMKRIAVSPIPNIGIGKTINERLLRASVKND